MDSISLSEKSLRLRYEAFSKFADELNKADNWEKVGTAITTNLKFIVDFFVFRLSFTRYQDYLTFVIFRGDFQYTLNKTDKIS